jgi:hypothetical protein
MALNHSHARGLLLLLLQLLGLVVPVFGRVALNPSTILPFALIIALDSKHHWDGTPIAQIP